ncbi:MAG: hypothetical protein Q7Q73_15530 [Verrucomicrobiota bacterium JB024]|nr:hypothetical protein [Verrucomicrobiota bacterium JB024]
MKEIKLIALLVLAGVGIPVQAAEEAASATVPAEADAASAEAAPASPAVAAAPAAEDLFIEGEGNASDAIEVPAEPDANYVRFSLGAEYSGLFDRDTLDAASSWLQFRARIFYSLGLASTPAGNFKLKGLAGTGSYYTYSWINILSTMGQKVPDKTFNMRQIYIQDEYEGWEFQGGVIPPNGGDITDLGYDSDGWVSGFRVTAPLGEGRLEAVTGIIDHLNDPNAFQEWGKWNYVGVKLAQPLPWYDIQGYLSYEFLQNENYVDFQLQRTWDLDEGMKLLGQLEAIHNFTTPSWAWGASGRLQTDWLNVIVEYTYINPDFGLRGELSEDFFTFGHRLDVEFNGPVPFVKGLDWFVMTDVAEQLLRVRAGFNIGFGGSTPGYLMRF